MGVPAGTPATLAVDRGAHRRLGGVGRIVHAKRTALAGAAAGGQFWCLRLAAAAAGGTILGGFECGSEHHCTPGGRLSGLYGGSEPTERIHGLESSAKGPSRVSIASSAFFRVS